MSELPFSDQLIMQFDTALRTIFPPEKRSSQRPSPGNTKTEAHLSPAEKKHVAGLMRVNHSGEVCAQALYQGQALTARLPNIREQMAEAALEEVDHLAWCEERLHALHENPSRLNFFWYVNSFLIGAAAGLAGDKYSLGFVAETEKQVSAHLKSHMRKLPATDARTRAILEQMDEDESLHAENAIQAGAATLPMAIQRLMGIVSKLMTKSSYYI